MADFFIRPKAHKDLEDIWLYTYETWGEDQADSYIYDLNSGFLSLAAKPEKGRPCDDVREGYRRHSVGKHIIFYRLTKKGLRSSAFFIKEWTRSEIFKLSEKGRKNPRISHCELTLHSSFKDSVISCKSQSNASHTHA